MSMTTSSRAKSRMERLGKSRHGRAGRRLREREASASNPVALSLSFRYGILRLRFASLRMTARCRPL